MYIQAPHVWPTTMKPYVNLGQLDSAMQPDPVQQTLEALASAIHVL